MTKMASHKTPSSATPTPNHNANAASITSDLPSSSHAAEVTAPCPPPMPKASDSSAAAAFASSDTRPSQTSTSPLPAASSAAVPAAAAYQGAPSSAHSHASSSPSSSSSASSSSVHRSSKLRFTSSSHPHSHSHSHSHLHSHSHTHSPCGRQRDVSGEQDKAAVENVAPFISKHSAKTYSSQAADTSLSNIMSSKPMYCNRHKPEYKCWRQANEPTMEELQSKLSRMDSVDQQGISHVWSLFSTAPSKQRELMLQGILAVCCFPQLSFISGKVRELIKIDFIAALPFELSLKILSFLDTVSLCKATQVNKTWNQLAEDDVVWHRMCEQHIAKKCKKCGWGLPLLDHHRLKAEKKTIERRALGLENSAVPPAAPAAAHVSEQITHDVTADGAPANPNTVCETNKRPADSDIQSETKRQCVAASSPQKFPLRPWKDVYRDRFKVGTNWKYGRFQLKVLKGHENGVMCIQMNGSTLASGSYDGTIRIWDLETGKVLRILTGHTSGIRCIQFSKNQLFSGSMDRTIRIWNWQTGELIRTLHGPMGDVLTLHYESGHLACGGKDNVVRLYKFGNPGEVFALRGHKDFVNSVRLDLKSETIFSAADDNQIRIWDLRTQKLLRVLEGHAGGIQQITMLPPQFELDESDLLDCEHHLSDAEQERDDELHLRDYRQQSLDEQDSLQVSADCDTDACRPTRVARSPVPESLPDSFVYPDEQDRDRPSPPKYIMTASLDNTLRLWHVPSGRCLRTFFGHVEGVWAIAADNLRVASGSQDRSVKLWDARTGKCERTYTGHVGPITCLALSGDRLVTGSEDCDIRVMEFGPP